MADLVLAARRERLKPAPSGLYLWISCGESGLTGG
jgi:hypothetical protein